MPTAVGSGFAMTFPSLDSCRESSSALGMDAKGLGNKQKFGGLERKGQNNRYYTVIRRWLPSFEVLQATEL